MTTEPAANGPPSPANQPTQATTASRYYVLALLVLINVLSYVDRHMLPAFAAQITGELELSRQQFGLLTGFAFVAVYALSGPVMGVLADRFNPSRVIAWGIALWSAMTWLTGLSRNFLQILLPRMAVGIGEAALHPAAAGILSRLFAPAQRATVFGLFFMGSHIGLGLAYWLAGTLGEAIGWRMMFMALGAAGLLLALVLVASARFKPKSFAPPVDLTAKDNNVASVRKVVGQLLDAVRHNAAFRQAVLGLSLLHAIYASGQFMQLWLVAEKGLPESTASSLYGSMYLLCAIPSAMLGGLAADWFVRRFRTTHALFVALVGAATWPLVILFRVSAPESASFHLGMGAAVLLLTFPYGAMISLVLNEAPRSIQSTAIAFTMFTANVLVIGTGTYAIGLFSDLLEAQQVAAPLTKVLLGADLVVLLAIILYFRLHRRIQSSRRGTDGAVSV